MSTDSPDFLILGAGVIGLALALEARKRHPRATIVVAEKEAQPGLHASGRNSGVLHAGFYYTADSLKARFTREGNQAWSQYCMERKLRIHPCGKLVVARHEGDLAGLDELQRRAERNQVPLERVTEAQAKAIEPRVKTAGSALFSPLTASVDPKEVMAELSRDVQDAGIEIRPHAPWLGCQGERVQIGKQWLEPGYLINAAGLYADHIAKAYGFCQEHVVLPFKGLYLKSSEAPGAWKTNIYPVPDLDNPFLGVHFTVTVDGKAKIGPTAIPAFWRQHYGGLEGFSATECRQIMGRELQMLWHNPFGFRRLAVREMMKYNRVWMAHLAKQLAHGVSVKDYRQWGPPGIRAQLYHVRQRRLEMDFHFEGDHRSFHVLNAVSPGFTCALPFAVYLFDAMQVMRDKGNP
ncbi:FAD dependent oxidoreductase [Magnetococcus marinus MC-1]|uniref:FAD dependent oxidoreductase n=1 Tax=Magnetococcus marinus (strain ATCC BAA-1437 / JCM 17883 / MC-1) TaxID=156889 RepID=A0LDV9_MAGMM|nr:FAD-dependent oxidoreductase [Magnetococcus marinus]ABK46152.1 FAD dependent oxidoreductase [Magnetococcus marinus MC-1]